MHLELIFTILSLAVSIGGVVAYFTKKPCSSTIILIILIVLVLISGVEIGRYFSHKHKIDFVSKEIEECLLEKGPRTIEQLKLLVPVDDTSDLYEAVNKLVESKVIKYDVRILYDEQRNSYQVGVYVIKFLGD
ncbi:MAG: hypothetical protein JW984_07940 [Deltaproteobacteria bacterium]|uniref:Uncharacterized protein n=1 Tax=Candidatus Zymogenus saltonus TaxID=2844893 RepID=A0A9D8PPQ1_9DELT|nr:hypothetical protein [Candidatus Zymogenus saltonus]